MTLGNTPGDVATPTILPPTPRVVRGGVGCSNWFLRPFSLALLGVALGLFGYFLLTLAWVFAGTATPGRIVSTRVSRGRSTTYYAVFTYRTPDGWQQDEESVYRSDYDTINRRLVGDSLPTTVRQLSVGPIHIAGLPEYSGLYWKPLKALFFLAFAGLMGWGLFFASWIAPAREKALLREGVAVLGAITDKTIIKGKSPTYRVKYAYKDVLGATVERAVNVPDVKRYNALQIGEVVTVLTDPRHPKRSTIYELSPFRVEGATVMMAD
jgi:hypothetical protein